MLRKIITWAIVIFVAFYLLTQPHGAANAIRGLMDLLKNTGNSFSAFVNAL
jgi:hypothetical protein